MKLIHKNEYNAHWFTIKTNSGLNVCLCNIGASVFKIKYKDIDCLYAPKTKKEFVNSFLFCGKTLGRVACRLHNPIFIDNKKYELPVSDNSNIFLHSGNEKSLSYDPFEYVVNWSKNKDKLNIEFKYIEKDLVRGFPGNCAIKIIYQFNDNLDSFKIIFDAVSDKKTYINLSNHMYFNFNNDVDLSRYFIKCNVNKYGLTNKELLIVDNQKIPEYLTFDGKQSIKEQIELIYPKTFDDLLIFDNSKNNQNLIDIKNDDIELKIKTTFPAFNYFIYDNKFIAIEPQKNNFLVDSITYDKNQRFLYESIYEFKKLR